MNAAGRLTLRWMPWAIGGVAGALLVLGVAIFAVPRLFGWELQVVLSGSMEPTYPVGSLNLVQPLEASEVEAGMPMAFWAPSDAKVMVTHRVVEVVQLEDGLYFRTQGDANEDPDPELVPADNVVGRVRWHIPYLGHLVRRLRDRQGFLLLMAVPAGLLVFGEIRNIASQLRLRKSRPRKLATGPPSRARPLRLPRKVAMLALLLAVLTGCAALAVGLYWRSTLGSFSGTRDESPIITTASSTPIPASAEIHPETLNVNSAEEADLPEEELPQNASPPAPVAAEPPPVTPEAAQSRLAAAPTPAPEVVEASLPPPDPAPPPPSPPPPNVPTVEYTVRAGESLSDVAAFFGTTVETIVALNGVANANLVVPGQVLLVPAPPANTAPGQAFMSEYVVQPGETLTDIAARFGTTVEALAAENGLANPSAVRIGDRLLVP
jgi:signal peptidase